jgi:predicted nucleotidyltransferase
MLERFITSKTKRKLLKLFILHPEESFYVREIEKLTKEPVTAVRRELGYLEEVGFLKSRNEGNLKYFQVNQDFPIYPELKRIIYSTIGFADYLKENVHSFDSINLAFIYGSVARNEETTQSDIDLLVVGTTHHKDFHKTISEIERETGREINYTLMTRQEFEDRLKNKDAFLTRVMKEEKILVKGTVDVHR